MAPGYRRRMEQYRLRMVAKMDATRLKREEEKAAGIVRYEAQAIWNEIREGMRLILERESISKQRYMELYSHVFNYCTHVDIHAPYSREDTLTIQGRQLYEAVVLYLKCHVLKILRERQEMKRDEMLNFYVQNFNNLRFSSKVLSGMFAYLNKQWIPARRLNKEFVLETPSLVLKCFKCGFFNLMREEITGAILDIIEQERNGEQISRKLVETVVSSYIEMGSVDRTAWPIMVGDQNLVTYVHHFEKKFLSATRQFYEMEANTLLVNNTQNSVSEYMKKVEQRIVDEERRIQILHRSTLPKLIGICEQTLIQPHLEKMYLQFGSFLKGEEKEDLRRLYNLVNRLDQESITAMAKHFEIQVKEFGENAIREIDERSRNDPLEYYSKISGVFTKYNSLVRTAFQSDMRFRASLDKGCKAFVNQNAVTGNSMQKSAMLLAKYSDRVLRKATGRRLVQDEDMEAFMETLVSIIRYLNDKDVFKNYYSMLFGNRLINETASSDDMEESFIGKLKANFGHEFTLKLQRMFVDMETSKQKTELFKEIYGPSIPFCFGMKVLTFGTWPFTPEGPLVLPPEMEQVKTDFQTYYLGGSESNKKLSWLHGRSFGELKYFPPGATTRVGFTLVASTYQIVVLRLFQSVETLTMSDVRTQTELGPEILIQVIDSLIKHKLLEEPTGRMDDDTTVLSLNRGFKSPRIKIHINTPLRSQITRDDQRVDRKVTHEREFVIQATIVRIMKMRKSLEHANLVAEIMEQVRTRFTPDSNQIKIQIETLIEKEFIRRSASNPKIYEYLS